MCGLTSSLIIETSEISNADKNKHKDIKTNNKQKIISMLYLTFLFRIILR